MNKLWWIGWTALLLGGCGEISYKRGASPADLDAARQSCRSGAPEKSVDKCLQDQGWVIRKPDDIDLFATLVPSNDARIPAAEPVVPPAPAAAPGAKVAAQPGAANPVQSPAAVIDAAAAAPKPPPGPLDVYTVGSWWKIGAGRESLEADMSACVKGLGDAHQPDAKTRQVTRGLVICMHDKGWKALLEK